MLSPVPGGAAIGRADDVSLYWNGDHPLLLHLPAQSVPDEDPGVDGEPLPGEPDLAGGISVHHSQHEPLELTPALSVLP